MDNQIASAGNDSRIEPDQVEIRIENVRTYNGPGVWCARPSPLSNKYSHKKSSFPYVVKVGSRAEAISKYKEWLDEELKKENSLAKREFEKLLRIIQKDKKITLLCWCLPLDCHLRIIKEFLLKAIQDTK